MSFKQWFLKYWFMLGLVLLIPITLADTHEWTISVGRSLKNHAGPDVVIFCIFLLSGLTLDSRLLRKGLGDFRASAVALALTFLISPLAAAGFGYFPLDLQILTGLFLVAAMPSTLSTGVVMTEAAGGNMAHALFVTILANILAVFTIPLTLSLLLGTLGDARIIQIDKVPIMLKIAGLVLAPLAGGAALQYAPRRWITPLQQKSQLINQLLVLTIVWMGMCQSRSALLAGSGAIVIIAAAAAGFHLILVLCALGIVKLLDIGPGRRESVIFMGGQKTLPLSVILQVTLFPDYSLALVVCVVHHVIHLVMDAYLVERLKPTGMPRL